MTKKISEFIYKDTVSFEFINFNSYEDIKLLSYLIENEMGAEVLESGFRVWSFFRKYRLNNLKFILMVDDDYGLCLQLVQYDEEKIEPLRQVAHELLNLIRMKSRNFISKKGQKLISASWEDLMREIREA